MDTDLLTLTWQAIVTLPEAIDCPRHGVQPADEGYCAECLEEHAARSHFVIINETLGFPSAEAFGG